MPIHTGLNSFKRKGKHELKAGSFNVQFYVKCAVVRTVYAVLERDLRKLHCSISIKRESS